jgi:Zn-dependent protease/CBS domain-containing protein
MKWSLYLGKPAGVRLFVHWTFLILIVWIFTVYYRVGHQVSDGVNGVLFILALFACVVLHELGHALAARRYGIATLRITLLPIGGLAQMERMPQKPWQEFVVAVAGPLVNVVIAGLLFLYLSATGGFVPLGALAGAQPVTPGNFLFNLFVANAVLVAFNLIPAFPMDGGRMARALLSLWFDRGKATRLAASLGQLLAIGFVVLGLYGNFWLAFIGLFIFLGAQAESEFETARSALAGYKVKDIIMTKYSTLAPGDTLGTAVDRMLDGQETAFLVEDGGRVVGALARNEIIRGLGRHGKEISVADIMRTDVPALDPDMRLQEIFEKMTSGKFSIAPVFSDGRLVGALDRDNISEFLLVRKALAG